MDEQTFAQMLGGTLFLVGGVLAWVLPYRWNPFGSGGRWGGCFQKGQTW